MSELRYVDKSFVAKLKKYFNPLLAVNWLYYKIFVTNFLYQKAKKGKYSTKNFTFKNKKYSYYVHKHNTTYYNERAIELSLVLEE